MEKKTILWIHGFAGRPNNDTILYMVKKYPEYEWYAIEVDHHALASMQKINEYLKTHKVSLVAGTSLGGYYAMCAEYNGPKLVVNPVVSPLRDLHQFLGKNSYKSGRPDGQLEFDFTEEMLQEFSQLTMQPLDYVFCEYTPHDIVLGEDIKKDYEQMFYHLKMMDEKVLDNHFMTFDYVKKGMKGALKYIFSILENKCESNAYDMMGAEYLYVPRKVLPSVLLSYQWDKMLNHKKVLLEIEQSIKDKKDEYYRKQIIMRYSPCRLSRSTLEYKYTMVILLRARKGILDQMYVETQDTFNRLKIINATLLDLTNRMRDKMRQVYQKWLDSEEPDWSKDCQVKGVIHIEQYDDTIPDDGTGSDYEFANDIIMDLDEDVIHEQEFSGTRDTPCDAYKLDIMHETPSWYYSGGGEHPFGDFLMCKAFKNLIENSLYARQDIMRMDTCWCDVEMIHQRIVTKEGKYI